MADIALSILENKPVELENITTAEAKEILYHLFDPDTGNPVISYLDIILKIYPTAYGKRFQGFEFKDNNEKVEYIISNDKSFWEVLKKDEALSTMAVDMINKEKYGNDVPSCSKKKFQML